MGVEVKIQGRERQKLKQDSSANKIQSSDDNDD